VTKPALDLILHARDHGECPHFLILDEMNLSHVERYFADILSMIESEAKIQLHGGGDRMAGETMIPEFIDLPKNLFIIGTVNVDETTYMFSPKVLDRANVIEFRMDDKEMVAFLGNPAKPDLSKLAKEGKEFGSAFVGAASDEVEVPAEVKEHFHSEMLRFFEALQAHGAEFGFRTAYEASRFVHFYKVLGDQTRGDGAWFEEAFDCVVFQKLLPKLHGSRAKLEPILRALWDLCVRPMERKSSEPESDENSENGSDAAGEEKNSGVGGSQKSMPSKDIPGGSRYPMSAEKIYRMWRLMMENGFASFAEA
jgi:5-methylcytosine-specific restriction protein B